MVCLRSADFIANPSPRRISLGYNRASSQVRTVSAKRYSLRLPSFRKGAASPFDGSQPRAGHFTIGWSFTEVCFFVCDLDHSLGSLVKGPGGVLSGIIVVSFSKIQS